MDEHMPTLSKSPQIDKGLIHQLAANTQQWDNSARIILFGSRAKNQHRYDSDYDLLILSQKFSGLSPEARWQLVQTQLKPKGFDAVLEPHCYTEAEWHQMQSSLLHSEVTAHGIDLREP